VSAGEMDLSRRVEYALGTDEEESLTPPKRRAG
jgi:hypothetical protein